MDAVGLLSRYIRIDTTNPPGNEKEAIGFLKGILEAEGLSPSIHAGDPKRPNLICRLQGDGSHKALILLHHADVVPAEKTEWSVDPFGGIVKDGHVWGRGALDMKGLGIMQLMAFLMIHREGLPLKRDILLVVTSDEETGSSNGARWLVEHLGKELRAEFLLNEGGYGWISEGISGFHCCVGEKGPLWLRLVAEGRSGHGSMPHSENPCEHMARALAAVSALEAPIRIVPEMRPFLERSGLRPDASERDISDHPMMDDPSIAAMFRNTKSVTSIRGGEKENVIPSRCEATVDCRLLPGEDPGEWIRKIENAINDPKVKIEVIMQDEPSSSPPYTRMWKVMEEVLSERFPDSPLLPTISPGFTDSRCFRKAGVCCYGLLPVLVPREELASIHGRDEKISIDNLVKGVEVVYEITRRLCSG